MLQLASGLWRREAAMHACVMFFSTAKFVWWQDGMASEVIWSLLYPLQPDLCALTTTACALACHFRRHVWLSRRRSPLRRMGTGGAPLLLAPLPMHYGTTEATALHYRTTAATALRMTTPRASCTMQLWRRQRQRGRSWRHVALTM